MNPTLPITKIPPILPVSVNEIRELQNFIKFGAKSCFSETQHPWDVEQVEDGKGLFGCSWFVTNVMTGASRRVGPVKSTGKNFYDQAVALADKWNDQAREAMRQKWRDEHFTRSFEEFVNGAPERMPDFAVDLRNQGFNVTTGRCWIVLSPVAWKARNRANRLVMMTFSQLEASDSLRTYLLMRSKWRRKLSAH